MKYDKLSIAAILAIAVNATCTASIPDSIPIHWGLTGKPDRYWPVTPLFLLPASGRGHFVTMGKDTWREGKGNEGRLTTLVILGAERFPSGGC
jgi:hypothetical protein